MFPHCQWSRCYSFSRSLTQIEWGILRCYARRIRSISILDGNDTLDWKSVGTFLNPPSSEPLFPNLRYLRAGGSTEIDIQHFLYMPLPSLISLDVWHIAKETLCALQGSLESVSNFSRNIRNLSIQLREPDDMFSKFFSSCVCRWRDLRDVNCAGITLDLDALVHLSRMPALSELRCALSATFPPPDFPIFFTNLHHLSLYAECLEPISELLSQTRLHVITDFTALIQSSPSKQDFSSFLANIQTSNIGHTIQELEFLQQLRLQDGEDDTRVLKFEDLRPCMAFSNLRRIDLNLTWKVDLTDSELLTLSSAWPRLEHLLINMDSGWNTPGGITPNGLLQLLQACRSLWEIALVIDTRGYTEFRESPASLGSRLPATFSIDVLDSFIEEESVPAIATFLAVIAPGPDFSFNVRRVGLTWASNHERRWYDAYERAKKALSQRS